MVFTASVPVAQLHPHQALALINRWAKLKGYWFYDDRDALYELKDNLIRQWVKEELMIATKIIQRNSFAIERMKEEILSGGMKLSHLNRLGMDWWDTLSQAKSFPEWQVLVNMSNNEIQVPLAESEQKRLLEIYEQEKVKYENLKHQYDIDLGDYRNAWKDFQKNIKSYIPILKQEISVLLEKEIGKKGRGHIKQVLDWLKSGPLTAKQARSLKNLLKQKNVLIQDFEGVIVPLEPTAPSQPKAPKLYQEIKVDEYIEGSLQHVENALEWARRVLERPELKISDIDDSLVNFELEEIVADEVLEEMRSEAIEIFKQVVNGSLTSPKEIYDQLTQLDLDYSEAIGMDPFHDYRWRQTSHGDFSKWHEINFSTTGFWLVEFESRIDSSVIFHIPYDRARSFGLVLSDLPKEESKQEAFGREISIAEQKEYPIVELLKILGRDASDFPYNLQNYSKVRYGYQSYKCWDDEDDYITEFDEDDWMNAGY